MGHKHSEETKRKISESYKGKPISEESKLKHSQTLRKILKENPDYCSHWKGKKLSQSHKDAIQKGSMGKKKPGTSIAMKKKWENYRKQKAELQEK